MGLYLASNTSSVSGIMTTITSVFTGVMTMLGQVVNTVTEHPLLLVFCILPLVGIGIGFFKRLAN